MLVDGSYVCQSDGFGDEPSSRYDPKHLICRHTYVLWKGARLRKSLQPRNFGGNLECVDQTAGSSSDISGQTIAFPYSNVLLTLLALRYHSVLPCPVSIAQRIRSCWDRSSFV